MSGDPLERWLAGEEAPAEGPTEEELTRLYGSTQETSDLWHRIDAVAAARLGVSPEEIERRLIEADRRRRDLR